MSHRLAGPADGRCPGDAVWQTGRPAGSPRGVQLILQALVSALQPIALPLDARQRVAQARNLLLLSFDQRLAILRRRRRRHIGHTPVMPEGRNLYKYEILDLRRSRAETR